MFKLRNKIFLVFLGFCLSLLIIELSLRLGGLIFMAIQEGKNKISLNDKGEYRILCLGESTTALGGNDSYPDQLGKILRDRAPKIKFSVINKGKPGINSTYILTQFKDNLDKYKPDMVVVMMGINDRGSYSRDNISPWLRFLEDLRVVKLTRSIFAALQIRLNRDYFAKVQDHFPDSLDRRNRSTDSKADLNYINNLIFKGTQLRVKNNYFESENIFRQVLRLDPYNGSAYVELAWIYSGKGDTVEAEDLFNKAIVLDPNQVAAFIGLGWLFRDQGKYIESEIKFRKAIAIDKKRDDAYAGLGWLYKDQAKYDDAKKCFESAIEINPDNVHSYLGLAWLYLDLKEFNEAILILKKALNFNQQQHDIYYLLATCYLGQNNYPEAEYYFEKVIKLNSKDSRSYGYLGLVYQKMGMPERADEAFKKATALRRVIDDSLTKRNYIKMKHILDARGIQMVSMQYPMISIESLKDFFQEDPGVIFVDNQKNFKDALKNQEGKDYFTDMFAGEFGHCTALGNRLIAQNVAEVILKVYVNKQ